MDVEPSEWVYLCRGCGSRIGVHKGTRIPLGMLADAETRKARIEAHQAFDALWMQGHVGRFKGYAWLAMKLGIEHSMCHLGWMDAELCRIAIKICQTPPSQGELVGLKSKRPWKLKFKLTKPLGVADGKREAALISSCNATTTAKPIWEQSYDY